MMSTGARAVVLTPAQPPPRRPDTAVRVVVAVVSSLALLAGLGMLVAGGALLVADRAGRDSDGFLTSPVGRVETASYAVTGEGFLVHVDRPAGSLPDRVLGSVRLRAESPDGTPLFLGVGPQGQVDAYLSGVAHHGWGGVRDEDRDGLRAPEPPTSEDFWVESATGPDAELTWDVTTGSWAVVLMDAEGQRGVVADVSVGVQAPWLGYLAVTLLVAGALLTAIATAGVVYALRDR